MSGDMLVTGMGGMGGMGGLEGITEEQLGQIIQSQPEVFQQIVEVCVSNQMCGILIGVYQELTQQDPNMLAEIQANPQQFLQLLLQGMQGGGEFDGEEGDMIDEAANVA